MSKKFKAICRDTGEDWQPSNGKKQYLMMYDSGYLAVVEEDFYIYITPLDNKIWKTVIKSNILKNERNF